MFVEIYAIVIGDNRPDSNVELASIEKERVLNVFLNDPRLGLRVLRKDELIDVPQISENLNALALVE